VRLVLTGTGHPERSPGPRPGAPLHDEGPSSRCLLAAGQPGPRMVRAGPPATGLAPIELRLRGNWHRVAARIVGASICAWRWRPWDRSSTAMAGWPFGWELILDETW